MKKIVIQYVLAILLAVILNGIVFCMDTQFFNIDFGIFLSSFYILILFFQILYYYLTTNIKIGFTFLSFLINFILWVFEQIMLNNTFQNTWFYQDSNISIILIGSILWATNKIIIDKIFGLNKHIEIEVSKLEKIFDR